MHVRVPEAPRVAQDLRRPPLHSWAAILCFSRGAERAMWPVGRAGATTSHGGLGAEVANFY
eukprot:6792024-Alexandrium_andersonii.AAC.1